MSKPQNAPSSASQGADLTATLADALNSATGRREGAMAMAHRWSQYLPPHELEALVRLMARAEGAEAEAEGAKDTNLAQREGAEAEGAEAEGAEAEGAEGAEAEGAEGAEAEGAEAEGAEGAEAEGAEAEGAEGAEAEGAEAEGAEGAEAEGAEGAEAEGAEAEGAEGAEAEGAEAEGAEGAEAEGAEGAEAEGAEAEGAEGAEAEGAEAEGAEAEGAEAEGAEGAEAEGAEGAEAEGAEAEGAEGAEAEGAEGAEAEGAEGAEAEGAEAEGAEAEGAEAEGAEAEGAEGAEAEGAEGAEAEGAEGAEAEGAEAEGAEAEGAEAQRALSHEELKPLHDSLRLLAQRKREEEMCEALGWAPTASTHMLVRQIKGIPMAQGSGVREAQVAWRRGVQTRPCATPRALARKSTHLNKLHVAEGRLVHEMSEAQSRLRIVIDTSHSMRERQRLTKAITLAGAFYLALTPRERRDVAWFRYDTRVTPIASRDVPHLRPCGGTSLAGLQAHIDAGGKHDRWLILTDGEIPDMGAVEGKLALVLLDGSTHSDPRCVTWSEERIALERACKRLQKLLR